ncbi:hypothetical protein [Psychrobacillus sp. NPDC093180]|uniref:hypothetical protein n=1 Tax=Psychrobacillus sp. NPDC093180 TaxID=3364489 RepID=UPI0037F4F972
MKKSKKVFVIGTALLLILIAIISIQLSNNLQIEDALSGEFFSGVTKLRIEKIDHLNFTELHTTKEDQKEIQVLIKELNLKRTGESYSPLDAQYRIVSTSNKEDEMYLFVEEHVIVFPQRSSKGYKIKHDGDLMKAMDMILR